MSPNLKYNSTYSLKIPSIEKRIEYREYTVGEEKEIVMIDAEESQSKKFYKIKNLVKRCLLTEIDFEKISPSEILFIFINMRIKSVGDENYTSVPCPKCYELLKDDLSIIDQLENLKSNETDTNALFALNKQIASINDSIRTQYEKSQNDVLVNLEKVKIIENKEHKKLIKLNDTLSVDMKYGINTTDALEKDIDLNSKTDEEIIAIQSDNDIELLARCIDTIYDGEETISGLTLSEKVNILKDMPSKYRKKLEVFLETQPKVEYKDTVKCKTCSNEFEFTLNSINDFF